MSMRRISIISRTSWLLLSYFALFIVPPLSSFGPVPNIAAAQEQYSLKQARQRAPVFLFDIIIWQQLEQTRHSEFLAPPGGANQNNGPADCRTNQQAAAQIKILFPGPDHSSRNLPEYYQSCSSDIRFSRSGTSPPRLS